MEKQTRTPPIDWRVELKAWRESGLPLSQFCREQGLVAHQLSYYKRKYEPQALSPDTQSTGFSQVSVLSTNAIGAECLSLRLASGHTIEGISTQTLPLVSALMCTLQ
jgi:hypothetical protein